MQNIELQVQLDKLQKEGAEKDQLLMQAKLVICALDSTSALEDTLSVL